MKHILTAITLYVLVTASASFAGIELNTTTGWTLKGAPLAMHGFDPVAYFTQDKALLGDAQFSTEYKEGTYRFISEANKKLFLKNPSAYVPQYGGYCAFGTAKGKKFDGDPRLFKVVDGKLYFNLNPDVYKKWLMDPLGYIQQADENWRDIHDKQPAELW
jgi:YHS domain-containing protein